MTEAGIQMGQPPSPEAIEKARKLAQDKGIDPEIITRMVSRGGQGGPGGSSGGSRRGGGSAGGGSTERFNNTVVTRTVYRLADPAAGKKTVEVVSAKLGVSDGFFTEVMEGLNEGDTIVTGVIMPGAAPAVAGASSSTSNPFSGGSSRGGFSGGSSSGMRGR